MKTEKQIIEYFGKHKFTDGAIYQINGFFYGDNVKFSISLHSTVDKNGITFEEFLDWWNNGEVKVNHIRKIGDESCATDDCGCIAQTPKQSRIATDYSDSLLMAMTFGTFDDIMSIVIKDVIEKHESKKEKPKKPITLGEYIAELVASFESAEPKRGDFCVFWDNDYEEGAICGIYNGKDSTGYICFSDECLNFDNCVKFTTIEDYKKLIGYAK